jgi:hypothetical protein
MTMILKLYMFLKERKRTIENAIVSLAFVVVAYLIHAFVVSLLTPKVPEKLEKPVQEVVIDKQTVAPKKEIVAKIEQKKEVQTKIEKTPELKGFTPIRKTTTVTKSKITGEELETEMQILRNKDGNTRTLVTTSDNQEIVSTNDEVVDDLIRTVEVQKQQRIYVEGRTNNHGEIAVGYEKRLSKHTYVGVEVSKNTRNENKVNLKIGMDF